MHHQIGDQRRGEAGAGTDASKNPAVGNAPFAHRNPARDELIRSWIDNRFAGPEKKSNSDK